MTLITQRRAYSSEYVTMKSSMILNCAVKGQRSKVKVTVENILKWSVLKLKS